MGPVVIAVNWVFTIENNGPQFSGMGLTALVFLYLLLYISMIFSLYFSPFLCFCLAVFFLFATDESNVLHLDWGNLGVTRIKVDNFCEIYIRVTCRNKWHLLKTVVGCPIGFQKFSLLSLADASVCLINFPVRYLLNIFQTDVSFKIYFTVLGSSTICGRQPLSCRYQCYVR